MCSLIEASQVLLYNPARVRCSVMKIIEKAEKKKREMYFPVEKYIISNSVSPQWVNQTRHLSIFYRAQQRLRSHEEIGTNSPPRVEGKKEHGLKEFLVFARPSSRPAIGLSGYVQVGHNARTG